MQTSANPVHPPHGVDSPSAKDAARVQQALEPLLSSPPFRNTQQCQSLLLYIVKHTLTGEDHLLRERVIGSEVFGRKPDYETGEDPVVRIRAAEVRKRLAQYYQSVSEAPELHIDIPSGSYRATFRWLESPPPAQSLVTAAHDFSTELTLDTPGSRPFPVPGIATRPGRSWHRRRWMLGTAAVLLLAFFSVAAFWRPAAASPFQDFWQLWTNSPKPVIIVIGSNAVYRLSDAVTDRYARENHLETHGMEFFVPNTSGMTINGSDIHPAYASFVALGDVAAVSNVVATITRQKQAFQERFPNDVSFAELRNAPTILIGGFNNQMTMELTKNLRFVMRARNQIDDLQDPARHWVLHASTDSHDTEDYAIITRLQPHSGDGPILSVAGMGEYGTLAAADFISNQAAIGSMTREMRKDWASRNLQIILHLKVIDFKPVATEVVAIHSW